MRWFVLAALAGCWTGGESTVGNTMAETSSEPVSRTAHAGFKVKVERTACMGSCPTYTLVIHGDGRVDWNGIDNVLAAGPRKGHVTDSELAELERKITALQFFERDDDGHLPVQPNCTTVNGTTSCSMGGSFSFCSDTSHTIITVTRRYKTHTIDNANCTDSEELGELETLIDRVANIRAWVGGGE